MKKITLFTAAIITIIVSSHIFASARQAQKVYIQEADTLFSIALSEYKNGRYQQSLDIIEHILGFSNNQRSSAAFYLKCRIARDRKDYNEASALISELLKTYPDSRYVSHARMLRAEIYFNKGMNYFALQELLWNVAHGDGSVIRAQAAEKFVDLFDPEIPEYLYGEFKGFYNDPEIHALVDMKIVQNKSNEGALDEAQAILESIKDRITFRAVQNVVTDLQSLIMEELSGDRYIAVLMPFHGEYAEKGKRIFNGADAALSQFFAAGGSASGGINKTANTIKLKPIDTEGSISKFPSLIKDIAADRSILGILGPVDPKLQALAGAAASIYKVPVVMTGNNEGKITEINDYLFQIKGSAELEGAALANFAVNELKFNIFAILSPIGVPEEQMAQRFALEVEKLGGNILAQEWYYPGTTDYKYQFNHIRKIGYDIMMKDSLRIFIRENLVDSTAIIQDSLTIEFLDSLTAVFMDSLTIAELDSIWYIYLDNLEARRKKEGIREVDSLDYSVYTYDAIFIPITTPEDLYIIPNQFAYENFNAMLLGNNIWYDMSKLDLIKRSFNTLYFTSDYFIDDFYTPWSNFRDIFRRIKGASPGIDEMYGYDAAIFILNGVSGALSRERFRENLMRIRSMPESARGTIEMDNTNQKSNWLLLQYKNGVLEFFERDSTKIQQK